MSKNDGEARNDPESWAARYWITLTDDELRLLRTRKSELGQPERQLAYRLLLALRPEECTYCRWPVCERSTWTGEIPIPAGTPNDGPGYTCPNCGGALIHYQGPVTPERHGFRAVNPEDVIVMERVNETARHM
jgi:hypothetical protein